MNRYARSLHVMAILVFVVAVPAGSETFAAVAALLTSLAFLSEPDPDAPWRSRDARAPLVIVAAGGLAAWLLPSPGREGAFRALVVYGVIIGAGGLVRALARLVLDLGGRRVAARRNALDAERRAAVMRMEAASRSEDDLRRVLARMDRVRDVVRTIGFAMRVPDILVALGRVAGDVLAAGTCTVRLKPRPGEHAEYVLGPDTPLNALATFTPASPALAAAVETGGGALRYTEADWVEARDSFTRRRGESLSIGRPLGGRHGDALILEIPSGGAGAHSLGAAIDDTVASESADLMASLAGLSIEKAFLLAEIEARSRTDALTGLTNRRRFDALYREEWARAERQDAACTVLMMDVDHFKSFNDTYGHAVGDLVLKAVAGTLAGLGRRLDVIARYGGEEFVAFLPETDRDGALILAERIRVAVASQRIMAPGQPLPLAVTLSIGVAARNPCRTPESLLEAADAALYRAKAGGRNRVEG